ncbi:TfuA-like protein [Streptomyces sp. NPDC048516]|uniref:TfuA-like protein n=1 Tax=Streptomyces sp. NPDC048516 TaxID=3365565 RepID=UPI00371FB879
MAVHVFVGPSCPEPLVLHHPGFVLHGPVKHGDLFSAALAEGDVAVIVDGIYHHRLALRHKEILDVLARGITVIGAASIGALRAAELDGFGMIGVGRVHHWYRTGVFEGDDAVSVAHSETGSPAGLNTPLVNLHTAMLAGCDARVLGRDAAHRLMARLEREYYPLRTPERVLSLIKQCGETAFADWYEQRLAAEPDAFDQKRADAREAFALAERLDSPAQPSPPGVASGERDWRTEYHRRWRNRFATATPDLHHRLAYQQIFDPGFPDVWWDFLNGSSAAGAPADSDGFRGHVRHELGPVAVQWLDDPALRTRITAVICPLPDLADPREAKLLLRRESAEDRARVADWLDRMRQHLEARPARSLGQIREAVCTRLLARIWGVDTGSELAMECGRRGFASPRQAAGAFRPFALAYVSDQTARTAHTARTAETAPADPAAPAGPTAPAARKSGARGHV